MIKIGVNPRSLDWAAVVAYAKARRSELVEQSIDLTASAESRLIAAARIAELDDLLGAPEDSRLATEAEHAAAATRRSQY